MKQTDDMADSNLITIGDFARMTQLSVKSLRHYHELGLLIPEEVDRSSSYRRYGFGQVRTAQVIRRLRDLEMPLREIKSILSTPDIDQRNTTIIEHLGRRERELAQLAATVASLRSLVSQEDPQPTPIRVEHDAAQRAVAIEREVTPESFVDWLPEMIAALVDASGAPSRNVPGALFPDSFFADGGGTVTGYLPVEAVPPNLPRGTEGFELEPADLAVIVHQGEAVDIDQAYARLGAHVCERAIGIAGPIRERFPGTRTPAGDPRVEICWPVFRVDAGGDARPGGATWS